MSFFLRYVLQLKNATRSLIVYDTLYEKVLQRGHYIDIPIIMQINMDFTHCQPFSWYFFCSSPIEHYKASRSRRPEPCLASDSNFFLSPISFPHGVDESTGRVWYKNCNMGRNQIAKIVSDIAKKMGWPGRITNHSIRKTLCANLFNQDVNSNMIIQISGHKNPASSSNYAKANVTTQKRLYNMLMNENVAPSCQIALVSKSSRSR